MSSVFSSRKRYTRAEVAEIIGLPPEKAKGGDWVTGYSRWGDEFFVFCNVGMAGRTGHDYPNRWDGKELIWSGKNRTSLGQPQIDDIVSGRYPVHIFWRGRDREAFTYAGIAIAVEVFDQTPVLVRWSFSADTSGPATEIPPPAPNSAAPTWRRGPPPSLGERQTVNQDGPTQVYLMALAGPYQQIVAGVGDLDVIVKVGISNMPRRRLSEINFGFPPGSTLRWQLVHTWEFPTAREAYLAEGRCLERFRLADKWIGGDPHPQRVPDLR